MHIEHFQTVLLNAWMQIISQSPKTSTLKYALARALIDVARENKGSLEPIKVSNDCLADWFIEYYWYQVLKFKLKQSGSDITDPNIVRVLKAHESSISEEVRRPQDAPEEVISKIRITLSSNSFREVVPRFHRIMGKNTTQYKFYKSVRGGIEIEPKVIEFLNKFRPMLLDSTLHHWTLWLERLNDAPKIAGKLTFDANRKRKSLVSYRKVLQREEETKCFFCREFIDGTPNVEHMIPRSYVFEDELWNLTLSCVGCNKKKSYALPDLKLIEELVLRNEKIINTPDDPAHKMLVKSLLNLRHYPKLKMKDAIIRIRDNAEQDGFPIWDREQQNMQSLD